MRHAKKSTNRDFRITFREVPEVEEEAPEAREEEEQGIENDQQVKLPGARFTKLC